MEDYDREAFSNMKESTASKPDKLFEYSGGFRESKYNTDSSTEDRAKYDAKAFSFLAQLYERDKEGGKFKNLNFTQFLQELKPSYIEELFGQSKVDDNSDPKNNPEFFQRAGDMLIDVYEGDADQLKVSAANFYKANYDFYGGGAPGTVQHSGDYSGPGPNMKPTPHTSKRSY